VIFEKKIQILDIEKLKKKRGGEGGGTLLIRSERENDTY
jgi:hypothetical protein